MGITDLPAGLSQRKLTPMLRQYVDAKEQCPENAILLFRMGDFYELFFEDARIAAEALDLVLTSREKGADPIPMAGVPHHSIQGYISRLLDKGFSVAICDQVEDPKTTKGIVKREITRLITPGTVCELDALDPQGFAYLAAIMGRGKSGYLLVFFDLLTAELIWTEVQDEAQAIDEIVRMHSREVLCLGGERESLCTQLKQREIPMRDWSESMVQIDTREELTRFLGGEVGQAFYVKAPHVAPLIAGCLRFVEHTQRQSLRHLVAPKQYRVTDALVLDETTRRNLELLQTSREGRRRGSLIWHLDRCRTAPGSRLLCQWLLFPRRDRKTIVQRQDCVEALVFNRALREELQKYLQPVKDIERLVGRVALSRANPKDLAVLRDSIFGLPQLRDAASGLTVPLGMDWRNIDTMGDVWELLDRALVADPPVNPADGGVFAKGYKEDLDRLIDASTEGHGFLAEYETEQRERTGIPKLKVRFNKVFGYFIEVSRAHSSKVPGDYVRKQTLVNAERYTTPRLKEFEDTVLNADALRKEREVNLFIELNDFLLEHLSRFRELTRLVAQTDVFCSLGQVADEERYVRPKIVQDFGVKLTRSRHPVVERLMPGGEVFVPNDIELDSDGSRICILTGPNMGGKSTVMRQTALGVILAHMGSFLPAEEATVGLFDRIFTRVGASDDLGRGQSTFMVEMTETSSILREATERSLVILDEVGRGTSTFDGVSIAWSVAEFLRDEVKCMALFATHYHEMTHLALGGKGVFNASVAVEMDGDEIVFLRELKNTPANRSYGIQVAGLAGLPTSVLKRAQAILRGLEGDTTEVSGESEEESVSLQPKLRRSGQLVLFSDYAVESGKRGEEKALKSTEKGLGLSLPVREDEDKSCLMKRLYEVELNQLTPLDALNFLASLKGELDSSRNGKLTAARKGHR
ncbi:MAG: DNA mismatch repair protein MutS [Myxococcota bacterium]|nr:DNA mismatch repair protein MutS [Myxococcota bacterium]